MGYRQAFWRTTRDGSKGDCRIDVPARPVAGRADFVA
jgi:hypothetical protein